MVLQAIVVAEGGGSDLKDRFGGLTIVPELFGALDAIADFLDEAFHVS